MSDSSNPEPDAPSSPPESEAPTKKGRSSIERAVVWGGILILLTLVGIESIGYLAQRSALSTLTEKLETGDEAGETLNAAAVHAIVGRDPILVEDVTEQNLSINAKRVEVYSWFTMSPIQKRELYVYYGIGDEADADVINVTTGEDMDTYQHAKPPEQQEAATAE